MSKYEQTLPFSNLPMHLTPFIGREREVAAACTLLSRPEVRLLTLTGAGGVGKTRLALAIATEMQEDFPGGVCFVSLAPIRDVELVLPAIVQALGLQGTGALSPLDHLKAALREQHLLVLLDNFEQVVAAAPRLLDLLAACPQVKLLVTSRQVLRVRGEREFAVLPLTLPDPKYLPDAETAERYGAIALFLDRAQAIMSDFQLTPANIHDIAEICVRLDGLPLAIELAAARIKLLPPHMLLTRLEHRLQVLTRGVQDAPARQRTLRHTLDWSYDLLDAREQQLFRRLSIFVGGCTLEAVEAMYGLLDGRPGDILDGVASLIDKNLLQQTRQEAGEPRLMMLETVREYGLELLAESDERARVQRAHATCYMQLAEEAETPLLGPQQSTWLERLEQEHGNLRAALHWSLEQDKGEEAREARKIAWRLVGALRWFWRVRGYLSEGRHFLEQALMKREGIEAQVQVKALLAAATLTFFQSDYDRSEALCEESLALCRELGDRSGRARALYWLGNVAWVRGDATTARSFLEEALALFRAIDDKEYVAYSLISLSSFANSQGAYARARSLLEESLAIHREMGNKRGIAFSLTRLAQVIFVTEDDQALVRSLIEESLTLSREVGLQEGIADSLHLSGKLALREGDVSTACALAQESVRLYKQIGHRRSAAEALMALGKVIATRGDDAAARALYEESLAIARELGDKWAVALCLVGLGEVVASQQQEDLAVQLWGAAESLRQAIDAPVPQIERAAYERAVEAAHTHLGERAFAVAWSQGRTMIPEQILGVRGQEADAQPVRTEPAPYPDELTAREMEVLLLVAQGLTDTQVAQALVISPRTVNAHLRSIYSKLGITSRHAATRYALDHHMV